MKRLGTRAHSIAPITTPIRRTPGVDARFEISRRMRWVASVSCAWAHRAAAESTRGERVGPADGDREDADDRSPRARSPPAPASARGRSGPPRRAGSCTNRPAGVCSRISAATAAAGAGPTTCEAPRRRIARRRARPLSRPASGRSPAHRTSLPATRSGKPCTIVAVQQQTARARRGAQTPSRPPATPVGARCSSPGASRRGSAAAWPGTPCGPSWWSPSVGFALLAAATLLAGWALQTYALPEHGFGHRDEHVNVWLAEHRTSLRTDISFWLSGIGDVYAIPALVAVTTLVAVVLRKWRAAAFILTAIALEAATYRVATLAIDRQRPHVRRLDDLPVSDSFYSGHTAASVAVYCGIALLITSWVRSRVARAHRVARRGRDPAARRAGADVPGDAPPDRRDRGPPRRHRVPDRRPDRRPRRGSRRTGAARS